MDYQSANESLKYPVLTTNIFEFRSNKFAIIASHPNVPEPDKINGCAV
jgi:hypothetical protein